MSGDIKILRSRKSVKWISYSSRSSRMTQQQQVRRPVSWESVRLDCSKFAAAGGWRNGSGVAQSRLIYRSFYWQLRLATCSYRITGLGFHFICIWDIRSSHMAPESNYGYSISLDETGHPHNWTSPFYFYFFFFLTSICGGGTVGICSTSWTGSPNLNYNMQLQLNSHEGSTVTHGKTPHLPHQCSTAQPIDIFARSIQF